MEEKPSASVKPYLDKLTLGVIRILGPAGSVPKGRRSPWCGVLAEDESVNLLRIGSPQTVILQLVPMPWDFFHNVPCLPAEYFAHLEQRRAKVLSLLASLQLPLKFSRSARHSTSKSEASQTKLCLWQ